MTNNIVTALALLIAPILSAQTTHEFTLAEAQQHAVQNSYAVQNARFDAEAARRQVQETVSIGLPQVNGTVDYQNYIDIPTQVAPADAFGFPAYLTDFLVGVSQDTGVPLNAPEADPNAISEFQFGAAQTATAGVSVSQLIFDGSYFVGLQAAEAYASLMESAIKKSEQEIKDQVAQAYFGVIMADENVAILQKSVDVMTSTLGDTQKMLDGGFVEQQDYDQLQLTLSDLQNKLSYADQQSKLARLMLKFNLALPLEDNIVLKDSTESLLGDDGGLSAAPFSALSLADYEIQQQNLELQKLNFKNEKVRGLPSIGAFYNYQRNAQRDEFNFFDSDGKWYPIQLWGVQMSVPIWTSFQGTHRRAKAQIEVERATMQLEQVAAGAKLEYESAMAEYAYAVENQGMLSNSLELAESIFNTTQVKFKEGLASSMDLTTAENQLLSTNGNYINATLQLLNAKSRLNKALGRY